MTVMGARLGELARRVEALQHTIRPGDRNILASELVYLPKFVQLVGCTGSRLWSVECA